MAVAAIFDTYKAVSMLEKRGLSKSAAEGITELLKDVTEYTAGLAEFVMIYLRSLPAEGPSWRAAKVIRV